MTNLSAIGFTAVGGSVVGASCIFLFGIAVRRRCFFVAPRCTARPKDTIYAVRARHKCQNRGNPFLGWVRWTLKLSYDTMLRGVPGTGTRSGGMAGKMLDVNLDGIVMLRFHAVCLRVAFITTVLALCVVLPINLTAQCYSSFELDPTCSDPKNKNVHLTDFDRTTLANIPPLSSTAGSSPTARVVNKNMEDPYVAVSEAEEAVGIFDSLSTAIWGGGPYAGLLARMYTIVLCSWLVFWYACRSLFNEWKEVLALRRVYYLENDLWGLRKAELERTVYAPCGEDSDDDLYSSSSSVSSDMERHSPSPLNNRLRTTDGLGDRLHSRELRAQKKRQRRREKLLRMRQQEKRKERERSRRDPWIPDPEQRETVPNIELYSVLVGELPQLPSEVVSSSDIEAGGGQLDNFGFSRSEAIDWQLAVVSTFFNHCVPNQPGFSSSVAAVTILPDAPALARAWRRWYTAAAALRRLRFIRTLINDLRHYDIPDEFDEESDEEWNGEGHLSRDHSYKTTSSTLAGFAESGKGNESIRSRSGRLTADSAEHWDQKEGTVDRQDVQNTSAKRADSMFHRSNIRSLDMVATSLSFGQNGGSTTVNNGGSTTLNRGIAQSFSNASSSDPSVAPQLSHTLSDASKAGGSIDPAERARQALTYYRSVFGADDNLEVESHFFQALNFGPEQTAVYSRELAQGAANCCPNGCGEDRLRRSCRIDELVELEREAVVRVHNANKALQYAQARAAVSVLDTASNGISTSGRKGRRSTSGAGNGGSPGSGNGTVTGDGEPTKKRKKVQKPQKGEDGLNGEHRRAQTWSPARNRNIADAISGMQVGKRQKASTTGQIVLPENLEMEAQLLVRQHLFLNKTNQSPVAVAEKKSPMGSVKTLPSVATSGSTSTKSGLALSRSGSSEGKNTLLSSITPPPPPPLPPRISARRSQAVGGISNHQMFRMGKAALASGSLQTWHELDDNDDVVIRSQRYARNDNKRISVPCGPSPARVSPKRGARDGAKGEEERRTGTGTETPGDDGTVGRTTGLTVGRTKLGSRSSFGSASSSAGGRGAALGGEEALGKIPGRTAGMTRLDSSSGSGSGSGSRSSSGQGQDVRAMRLNGVPKNTADLTTISNSDRNNRGDLKNDPSHGCAANIHNPSVGHNNLVSFRSETAAIPSVAEVSHDKNDHESHQEPHRQRARTLTSESNTSYRSNGTVHTHQSRFGNMALDSEGQFSFRRPSVANQINGNPDSQQSFRWEDSAFIFSMSNDDEPDDRQPSAGSAAHLDCNDDGKAEVAAGSDSLENEDSTKKGQDSSKKGQDSTRKGQDSTRKGPIMESWSGSAEERTHDETVGQSVHSTSLGSSNLSRRRGRRASTSASEIFGLEPSDQWRQVERICNTAPSNPDLFASNRSLGGFGRRNSIRVNLADAENNPAYHFDDGVWNMPDPRSAAVETGHTLGAAISNCFRRTGGKVANSTNRVVDEIKSNSTYAVVTFTNRQAAVAARHLLADGRGANRWIAVQRHPVPPLADSASCDLITCRGCCRPVTININKNQQTMRKFLAYAILALIYIFYTVPITFAASFIKPEKLFEVFPGFEELVRSSPVFSELLSGIVPALLFALFFALCPVIFKAIANAGSNATSVVDAESAALSYYWWFMVVTAFSGSSVFSMVLSLINQGKLGVSLAELLLEVAQTIPTQVSAVWINWIILRTTMILPNQYLLQLNTFLFHFIGWNCCKRAVMGGGPGGCIPYRIYVDSGVVFMCNVALSFASPLVAPCVLVYFMVCTPLWRRNCIFIYRPKYDGGGLRWPFLFDVCITGMIVGQILLSTMMVLKEAIGPAIMAAMAAPPTLLFRSRCRKRFYPAYEDAGLLQTSLLDEWDSTVPTSLEKREAFRSFLVDAHKAAYIPVCIAGDATSVLTAEPAIAVPLDYDEQTFDVDAAN